jgi:hypothetical protein
MLIWNWKKAIGVVSLTAICLVVACSDDDEPNINPNTGGSAGSSSTNGNGGSSTSGTGGQPAGGASGASGDAGASGMSGAAGSQTQGKSRGFYFSADTTSNTWTITIVDPTASSPVVSTLTADDLAALTGPSGNSKGPGWGDSIASPDGKRVFANASNADRVLVIETATPSIETVLKGGAKPLHIYNPNDSNQIWSHNDTDGSFTVVNTQTLAISGPFAASLAGSGHGKLVYDKKLGTKYFATNTSNPGGFVLEGDSHTATFLSLCAIPCVDDPNTPEDESLNKCGGTHDKAYDSKLDRVIFQCSGVTGDHVAFVQGATNQVVQDMVPFVTSGFTMSHDHRYILSFDTTKDEVGIWDTEAPGHDGMKFDTIVKVNGTASVRGTSFSTNEMGQEEAWIPQSTGTKLVVLNLVTNQLSEIEIGTLSPPAGATSVTRRGEVAGNWFYTNNDSGLVMVNVKTKAIVTAPQPTGTIQRVNGALVP